MPPAPPPGRRATGPISGADFVYKVAEGKYVLYSIGQDLKDDGGTPINWLLPKSLQQKRTEDQGDLGDIPWLPWRADVDYSSHIDRGAGPPPGPPPVGTGKLG